MTATEHLIMFTWRTVMFLNITAIRIVYYTEKLFLTITGKK